MEFNGPEAAPPPRHQFFYAFSFDCANGHDPVQWRDSERNSRCWLCDAEQRSGFVL